MKCLIVDDNEIALKIASKLCSLIEDIVVVGECSNAFDAYNIIKKEKVDLLLLDVEMEGLSGLELSRNIENHNIVIIYISSKKEYAIDAFNINVADYLVKPVSATRFIQAVDKAKEIIQNRIHEVKSGNEQVLFVRDAGVIKKINLCDLLYVEAMGDYVKLYIGKRYYTIHTSLRILESRLPESKYIRVHRSYIVAIEKIDSIEQGVLNIDGKPIPVSDAYKVRLHKKLNIL